MLYCINNIKKDRGTAGAKAPRDCLEIAKSMGAKEIIFYEPKKFKNIKITRFFAMFTGFKNWRRLYHAVEKNAWVIIQHPNENIMVGNKAIDICRKKKNVHFIGFIHDLDSLRRWAAISGKDKEDLDSRNNLADEVLLKKCSYIICHNDSMKAYLCSRGFAVDSLVSLKIFDYLHGCELPASRPFEKSIVVAGNLDEGKCGYLYKLIRRKRSYKIHLFGPNYTGDAKSNLVEYHGILPADELPGMLQGAFGLVWDGESLDACMGDTGAYLRYNNPHKVSLFIASNIPVIIWKEAALASFIEENHLGITISSLSEIDSCIEVMTEQEYSSMMSNVIAMGKKLRSGYFAKQSIKCVMEKAGI